MSEPVENNPNATEDVALTVEEDTEQNQTSPPEVALPSKMERPIVGDRRQSLLVGTHVAIGYNEDTLHEKDEAEEEVKLRWNMRRTAEKPCACCCQLCIGWILLFVLLLILGATVGVLEFSLSVPFYDRSELNQQREDAFEATKRDADFVSTFGQDAASECVHDDPTVLTRNGTLLAGPMPSPSCQRSSTSFFRIMYVVKDRTSNILTEKNLRQIQDVENFILSNLELTRHCYLIDSAYPVFETRNPEDWIATLSDTASEDPTNVSCERINSVLNFLDPLYFDRQDESGLGYYLIPNDQVPQEYNYSSLGDVIEYWSDFDIRTYNLNYSDFVVQTIGDSITLQNLFWRVTSSDFRVGATDAVGVTSTFSLGIPINSYSSSTEDATDQHDETGTWLWETFDSYLKGLNLDGMEIYWNDSENGMGGAEEGALALQSMLYFPASMGAVLLYLMYMQDSMFIGLLGIFQIMLSFIPTIIFYRYIVGQTYLGVLNLIAIYIILGIGVDNIFVFCDQFHHQRREKELSMRLQKTFNVAGKSMFTTSCTTFVSFIANATSAFPAVSTFGIFAALLVLMNFLAVMIFFPAVYSVYWTRVRQIWWDHPSLLFCCKREVPGIDKGAEEGKGDDVDEVEKNEGQGDGDGDGDGDEGEQEVKGDEEEADDEDSSLVRFFRDTWAPWMIKLRYPISLFFLVVLVFAAIGATQLQPDEEAPSTLPNGNNYKDYPTTLLEYFSRAGNPRAITAVWISGINPDDPIDRSGTDETNNTDYGVANYLDCDTFNPTKPEAQVWTLQSCHDLFFGNVTEYHGEDASFGLDGENGPKSRLMITENVAENEFSYYSVVSCPIQGMRDWLLTDSGCVSLKALGLECFNETSTRANCTQWDTNGNSCEPFPTAEENFLDLLGAFMQDPNTDPTTQQNNFDRYSEQILVDDEVNFDEGKIVQADFTCRSVEEEGLVLFAISTLATLDQDFAQNYEDGIALYEKWDAWSVQMRANAPRSMIATMLTSQGSWGFYFLNETLIGETFNGIILALGLSLVILTLVSGNVIMAFFAVLTIVLIVVDVIAFTWVVGWSLGVVEAVNYVVVIGMSIDYSVHMCEAYTSAQSDTRNGRVVLMLEEMGVSVLSGALSTLLAVFFMFFAPNLFFVKFATFLFVTIALSCIYSMTFFPAMLAIMGPLGNTGEVYHYLHKLRKHLMHEFAYHYVQSKEFVRRETEKEQRLSQVANQQ